MFLTEMVMQEELAQLNSDIRNGTDHLNDLRSSNYDFYNESAITSLQNKIFDIKRDIKELLLDGYISSLQEIAKTAQMIEKELLYNDIRINIDRALNSYRNSIIRYKKQNFGL